MTTAGVARPPASATIQVDEEAGAQRVVVVYDCSRLGRTANPPGFAFANLFRFGRRRR